MIYLIYLVEGLSVRPWSPLTSI